MPLGLGKLWARVTGLKDWDREVEILHNTVDDDTPAPGVLPGQDVARDLDQQVPLTREERHQRYEVWEGDDPGH
jgi:hypothetical protein